MLVLGLQGSPRAKGNTDFLLSAFMTEAEQLGAQTHIVRVAKMDIIPCREYIVCEKKGFCPIDDDMSRQIYPLLRRAEIVVAATPVFFYNTTAQLKALIDRSQTLWARKYKLKLNDPAGKYRRGFLLAVGATKGKNLFEGLHLTMKYFFDAVGAAYEGSLTYRRMEHPGDMAKHPTVLKDVKEAAYTLLKPFLGRKKILFVSRGDACRSQMAAAFAQYYAGKKIEAICAGSDPAENIHPLVVKAMSEKGIDMGFRPPKRIKEAVSNWLPDLAINVGGAEAFDDIPAQTRQGWRLPDVSGKTVDFIRGVRDRIEEKIKHLIDTLS